MLQGWHDLASVHWPSFGRWSTFPETNVRTYVVAPDGRRAVCFFSTSDLTELEKFVTARWGLVSTFAGVPLWAAVEHPPWVIHRSSLLSCEDTLLTATGLPSPTAEPIVLWSPGVEVRIGRPRRLSSLRQQ